MTITPARVAEIEKLIAEAEKRKAGWSQDAYMVYARLPLENLPDGHFAHRLADALRDLLALVQAAEIAAPPSWD